MIESKKEYIDYLESDKKSLGISRRMPIPFMDEIWNYERKLRKCEYLLNVRPILWRIRLLLTQFRKHRLSLLCGGYAIPSNICEKGLALVHMGSIVISDGASIGENCRIHEGVTIGATNGNKKAAKIGKNVFIGSGAKIIGTISITDNVCIGAGAVVIADICEPCTVGGIPAKCISKNTSKSNMPFGLYD